MRIVTGTLLAIGILGLVPAASSAHIAGGRKASGRLALPQARRMVQKGRAGIAGSAADLARSDLGAWSPSHGPEGGAVAALAVDPINPQVVYAGTRSSGVFASEDGGGSWKAIWKPPNDGYGNEVAAVAVDPRTPTTVFIGLVGGGVYKTTNGGVSWRRTRLRASLIGSLAIDPQTPTTVYAGSSDSANVFKSTNGGQSWIDVSPPSEGSTHDERVEALAIDPQSPKTIYVVAVTDSFGPGRVFKSTNGGATWARSGSGLDDVLTLTIDPTTTNVLYAGTDFFGGPRAATEGGVHKSMDGGRTWASKGLTRRSVDAIAIDPQNPQVVYAATPGAGILKSTNGGSSWQAVNGGLAEHGVGVLAIDPQTPTTLFAGGGIGACDCFQGGPVGLFKTEDAGKRWRPIVKGLVASEIQSLAVAPREPRTLYTSTLARGGVFKSNDGGQSWVLVNQGLTGRVGSIAVDPRDGRTVYAIAEIAGRGTLFKSTNGGLRWRRMSALNSGGMADSLRLTVDPADPKTLYASADRLGDNVFKSRNGGRSWIKLGLRGAFVEALAIDPKRNQTVYAGATDGVFESTNGGRSWVRSGYPDVGAPVQSLAIDPTRHNTVYAGTFEGIWKTTNAGHQWQRVNVGLRDKDVYAVAIDPRDSNIVYAGTSAAGVFRSTNGGRSWNPFNHGLADLRISALVFARNGVNLYAGTSGSGVFGFQFAR